MTANNRKDKLFLQNGDPVRNCKELHKAYKKIACKIVPISVRTLDINPVGNVFNDIQLKLRIDAWEQEKNMSHMKSSVKGFVQLFSTFLQKL